MGAIETLIGALPIIGREANQAKKGRRNRGEHKLSSVPQVHHEPVVPPIEPTISADDEGRLEELLKALETVEPER